MLAVACRAPDGEWPSWEPLIRLAPGAGPEHGALAMDTQRFSIKGRVISGDDPLLQDALAQVHESAERPRCLCVPGGIEMDVARHRYVVVKRMPETGSRHHPSCTSCEPDPASSGLGKLVGDAVRESPAGEVDLCVDFPWTRNQGHGGSRTDAGLPGGVEVARRRISLHGLIHFLFERAGFNRWTPAMEGKVNCHPTRSPWRWQLPSP